MLRRGSTCQGCPLPRATLQVARLLAVAAVTPLTEEEENSNLSHGGGEKQKWWVTFWLSQLCGLQLKKPTSLQQHNRFLRKDLHDLAEWEEREWCRYEGMHFLMSVSGLQQEVHPWTSGSSPTWGSPHWACRHPQSSRCYAHTSIDSAAGPLCTFPNAAQRASSSRRNHKLEL